MNKILIKLNKIQAAVLALLLFASCNKIYEPIPASTASPDTTNTVAKLIEANTSYSFFTAALKRTGMYARINTPGNSFTVYAPSDAAFTASGISLAAINGMPLAQLTPLISYHILQNEKLMNSQVPAATVSTPNLVRVSTLSIGTLPASATANFPLWMPGFPGKNASASYLNNIPVVQSDVVNAANGVMHSVAAPVVPPTRVLLDSISRDTSLSYFMAAIVRADSGVSTSTSASLQYGLSLGVTNFTVFAPSNDAFRTLVFGLVYQKVFALTGDAGIAAAQANGAVAAGPAFLSTNNVTTQLVKGIVVYHMLGKRYFSVNFPTTAASYPTLLNTAISTHPGLSISTTLISNFGAAVSVKGVANATAASAVATATGVDRNAVNGNLFKINQVLMPQ